MKHWYKTGLLICIALLLCGNASALQLIYPFDGTYVTKSNYLIVKGGTDPLLSGLTIAINGVNSDIIDVSSEAYRAAFGDMLIVEPAFDPGENRIVVAGFLEGEKMTTVSATVYYQDRYDQAPPEGYARRAFHGPGWEEPCAGCHNVAPSPADLASPDPRKNPCGSCHMRMLTKAHVHGPAGVLECTSCHDVDSTPVKFQVRQDDATLCLGCHDDMQKSLRAAAFVHGPVEAGLCLVCHDPHASDERSQLLVSAYDLCTRCHAKVLTQPHVTRGSTGQKHPLRGVVNPSGSGEDISCASCHDPHQGTVAQLFKWGVEGRFGLCAKCHNK